MVCVSTRERFKLRIALSIESALVRFQSGHRSKSFILNG